MKRKNLGSVNPCAVAFLINKEGKNIGQTLDTPNAVAYAMAINKNVVKSVAYYPMFGDKVYLREELADRFRGVMWDMMVLSSYLTWN